MADNKDENKQERIERKKQKLTQEQLTEKLGITYKAVSKWETGKDLPDAFIMMDLCNILEISVGAYKCKNCGYEIESTCKKVIKK